MSDSYYSSRLILGGLVLVVLVIAVLAEVIDRHTEPPIMRERVNDASDEYLRSRGTTWQAALESTRAFFRGPT